MKKIIFICKRNRFRSQIAKGLCNQLLPGNLEADSYGFLVREEDEIIPFSENPKVNETIKGLKEIGIDISEERSKNLSPEKLKDVDRIVVLTEEEDIPDWFKNNYQYEHWDEVKNFPGSPTLEKTRETIDLIKKRLSNIIS